MAGPGGGKGRLRIQGGWGGASSLLAAHLRRIALRPHMQTDLIECHVPPIPL